MYTPIVLTKNYAMYNEILKDRMEAANLLSEKLKVQKSNSVVIAIPRGGVPLGYEIARNLQLPLDVVLSKIGHPFNKICNWSRLAGFYPCRCASRCP
jgi:predicted phosphoribosyltransferase